MEKALRRLRHSGFYVVHDEQTQISNSPCSFFSDVPLAPPNAVFHTKTLFKADPDPRKINLGQGAYRTNEGKPLILQVVRKAEASILTDRSLNKEYLPITGHVAFSQCAQKLIFGENSSNICSVQCLSGTGSLRIASEFIKKYMPGVTCYYSKPTWPNHGKILQEAGVPMGDYSYWNAATRGIDFDGLMRDLTAIQNGSIVLLHSVAHNPTGVDPTRNQWKAIADLCKKKNLFPWFDSAYQGFASGDLDRDSWPIRYFYQQGFELMVCQSFAKNLGLYNERIGAIHIVTKSAAETKAVKSQIALIVRPMYSNPPAHGARIVEKILTSPILFQDWKIELRQMSERIGLMRTLLRNELERLNTPGDWSNITNQIGMFSFTGLTKAQSEALNKNHHIYMLSNGRISMPGITTKNVKYLAECIDYVVRNH